MLIGTLLMTTTLFNTQQNSITLFSKDPVAPGTYKVRVHANTVIEKAESDLGSCNVSGQDAVCTLNITADKGGNLFLSTLKLQKRADGNYIVDYSSTDPALKPTPAIFNSNSLSNNVAKVDSKAKSSNITTKKTGLNFSVLLLMILVIVASLKLVNTRKSN